MITHEELLKTLLYDPITGVFTWLKNSGRGLYGKVAGSPSRGRIRVVICGKGYFAHRLAWFYIKKEWPDGVIDHINGDAKDNRIANLRLVDVKLNTRNLSKNRKNTSGYNGVNKRKNGRFEASIRIDGRHKYLGVFDTAYEAHQAFEKEKLLHGFTFDHGIRSNNQLMGA